LENDIELTARKIHASISQKNERLKWLGDICKFVGRSDFDRALITRIIRSIHVKGKDRIEIDFVFEI